MITEPKYTRPKVIHRKKVLTYLYEDENELGKDLNTRNRIVERIRRRFEDADKRRLQATKGNTPQDGK